MTREEFEYAIKSCGCYIYRGQTYYEESELIKAFEDLGLIEQEQSEDAISRQGDDRWLLHFGQNMAIPNKTGHWIDRDVYDADRWKCSECGRTESYKENYCPNCGAKMVEEQERSE